MGNLDKALDVRNAFLYAQSREMKRRNSMENKKNDNQKDVPVEALGLSPAALNFCKLCNVHTAKEAVDMDIKKGLSGQWTFFVRYTLSEIQTALRANGYDESNLYIRLLEIEGGKDVVKQARENIDSPENK